MFDRRQMQAGVLVSCSLKPLVRLTSARDILAIGSIDNAASEREHKSSVRKETLELTTSPRMGSGRSLESDSDC